MLGNRLDDLEAVLLVGYVRPLGPLDAPEEDNALPGRLEDVLDEDGLVPFRYELADVDAHDPVVGAVVERLRAGEVHVLDEAVGDRLVQRGAVVGGVGQDLRVGGVPPLF